MSRNIVRSSSQKTGFRPWAHRWTLLSTTGPTRLATMRAASRMGGMVSATRRNSSRWNQYRVSSAGHAVAGPAQQLGRLVHPINGNQHDVAVEAGRDPDR